MAAVFGTLADGQMGNSHRRQETERSPWEFSAPVNQEVRLPPRVYSHQCFSFPIVVYTLAHVPLAHMFLPSSPPTSTPRTNDPRAQIDPSTSTSYSTSNQPPQQKLNFNPPSPPNSNGISPARNLSITPERHGQAYLTGKQSQPRSGAGMDPSYLSPPSKIGSRPELSASRSGSEADSLLDLYSKPRSLGESSLRESIDRVLPQEEPFLEDEDPERSRWIHRDKLAMIESHEMQEAGIKLPPQRKKSTVSRSRSRREKNRSQDHTTVVADQDEEMPSLKEQNQRRTEPPARQDDGDNSLVKDFDIRTPEEIAADNYMESNASNGFRQQQDLRKSSSRIPLPRSSPMPIPQEHIERDTPLPRKRGVSGNYSNADDNSLSYPRVRSRNNSVGSAILLDDMENIPDHTPTPASGPAPLGQPNLSKPQRTPSSAQRPKSRSGLETTPLSQKPRIISTSTTASPRTPSSTNQRPKSRSGLDPRPATAINRPEGEAPWLATMYKPDPRLPPEEQILPTHAKRLQQEQWERAQKDSQQRIRELEAQQRKHNHDKPPAELPRDFSPLAEHTVNGLQPSSRDADEKVLQEQSASEWPLTQATPRNPPASGGFSANPAPTADGGQHAGYSPIPRVKQGASPTLGNITDIRPGQRVVDPFERERMARMEGEKGGKEGGGKKEKGCGCCVVM